MYRSTVLFDQILIGAYMIFSVPLPKPPPSLPSPPFQAQQCTKKHAAHTMSQAWVFLLDGSVSMGSTYTHPVLLKALPSALQDPPPTKLQVAQEITTLLFAAQAVAEAGKPEMG